MALNFCPISTHYLMDGQQPFNCWPVLGYQFWDSGNIGNVHTTIFGYITWILHTSAFVVIFFESSTTSVKFTAPEQRFLNNLYGVVADFMWLFYASLLVINFIICPSLKHLKTRFFSNLDVLKGPRAAWGDFLRVTWVMVETLDS